jgi:hypothetical protein
MVLGVLLVPAMAWAQNQPAQNRQTTFNSPLNWSVDFILNNYVRQVSTYYKLTPEQESYTRGLLSERVHAFLKDHEKDVRLMAAEMMDYKFKGQLPPPEIAKVWAQRAQQMMPAIRAEIMEGNVKWRDILDEEQKKQHDRDIEGLERQFDGWNKMFDRWSRGEIAPTDLDTPGQLSRQPRTVRPSEDAWEFYVRTFIQMYNLDEGQQQTANSILRESKEQAVNYREGHKTEFAQLDAADQAVVRSDIKKDPEELKKVQEETRKRVERRRELEKPISEIFERLKGRLNDLPTAEQRRVYNERFSKLETRGRKTSSKPAVEDASTQPTTAANASP